MIEELAKPIALVICVLALCAVFNAAFLHPVAGLEQRAGDCLLLLALAGGASWASGMIFREADPDRRQSVMRTLPMRMFCWSAAALTLLFLASWYMETSGVFYRDLRPL